MQNIYVGTHIINITGLSEAELERLQRSLEVALDDVEEALNREEVDFVSTTPGAAVLGVGKKQSRNRDDDDRS